MNGTPGKVVSWTATDRLDIGYVFRTAAESLQILMFTGDDDAYPNSRKLLSFTVDWALEAGFGAQSVRSLAVSPVAWRAENDA